MATTNGPWSAVSASVRGASHDRTGLPNQDAHAIRVVDGPAGGLVVAVADGHGGARYVRSGRGSAFAVDVACDLGSTFIKHRGGTGTDALVQTAGTSLVPGIVEAWRRLVRSDLDADPLTEEELDKSGDLGEGSFLVYGSTLLVALVWGESMMAMQLGDGDVVVVFGSGAVDQPVPDDPRLVAGETTSLGLPDAVDSFRLAAVDLQRDPASLVLLSTDGYGNSFADPAWPTDVGPDLLERVRKDGLDTVGEALPAWLAESAVAGGDDVTMALVATEAGAVAIGAPVGEIPQTEPLAGPLAETAPTTTDPRTSVRAAAEAPIVIPSEARTSPAVGRSWARAAGAVVIALVLVLIGALIGRSLADEDSKASEPSVTTSETTADSSSPSTASPDPTTTLGPVTAGDRLEAIVLANGVVEFRPADPTTASYSSTDAKVSASKTVLAATRLWDISSGKLVVKEISGDQQVPIVPNGFKPGGLIVAAGDVWLASTDGKLLLRCDAETVGCKFDTVPIQPAGEGTEQSPGTTA